jgi:hypothetical protein
MQLELVRVSRRPPWPWWVYGVVFVWAALGLMVLALSHGRERPVELCNFKRLTGIPCPTCGFTRGTLRFLGGHPVEGWLFNPLLFTVLALFGASVVLRVVGRRAVRLNLSRTQRKVAWAVAIGLVLLNWLYVIVYVG